jgi:hypothetical protein
VLLRVVEGNPLLKVRAGGGQLSEQKEGEPQRLVGPQEEHGVLGALRQREELCSQLMRHG